MRAENSPVASSDHSRELRIALWIVQIALAVVYGAAGYVKATAGIDDLAARVDFIDSIPPIAIRALGGAQLAAAFCLIVPGLVGRLRWLAPLTACGLLAAQLLAIALNLAGGSLLAVPLNLALAGASLFVIWGRWFARPIQSGW